MNNYKDTTIKINLLLSKFTILLSLTIFERSIDARLMGSNVWKIITRRKVSSATDTARDRFFWFYSRHKTVPPAIFYLLVINRFLKPNRISPYLSRRIYPVRLHVLRPWVEPIITVKTKNIFPIALRHNSTWTQLEDSNDCEYSSREGNEGNFVGTSTRLTSFRKRCASLFEMNFLKLSWKKLSLKNIQFFFINII